MNHLNFPFINIVLSIICIVSPGSATQRFQYFCFISLGNLNMITSPFLALLVREPSKMFKNIINVFKGKFTWVGYSKAFGLKNELPVLKSSVLSPLDRFNDENLEEETIERINIRYAKDYNLLNDLTILIKGLKRIDQ